MAGELFQLGNQYDANAKRYAFRDRNHVKEIQRKMIAAGAYGNTPAKADGAWGHASMAAYERWKKMGFNKYGHSKEGNAKILQARRLQLRKQAVATKPKQTNPSDLSLWDKAKYVFSGDKDSEVNAAGRLAETFGAEKNGLGAMGAEMASYFTPFGNALSLNEALNNARDGKWGDAALNGLFAIPVIGNIGKGIQVGAKALKLGERALKAGKTVSKVGAAVDKPANLAMKLYGGYGMGQMGVMGVQGGKALYDRLGNLAKAGETVRSQADYNNLTPEGQEIYNINDRIDAAKYMWHHRNDSK